MINLVNFGTAALQAFDDVREFLGAMAGPTPAPLAYPFVHKVKSPCWYVNFAYKFTGVSFYPFSGRFPFPLPGFGSWLVARPKPAITINEGQLQTWAGRTPNVSDPNLPDFNLPVEVQKARVVLHEVGHLKLHRRLLENPPPDPGNYAWPSNPREEEQAWVYAMCALAILLGGYARSARDHRRPDDSSAVSM